MLQNAYIAGRNVPDMYIDLFIYVYRPIYINEKQV